MKHVASHGHIDHPSSRSAMPLLDGPGIAGAKERVELAGAEALARGFQLARHVLGEYGPLDRPEDADGGWARRLVGQVGQGERLAGVRVARVVDDDCGVADLRVARDREAPFAISDDRSLPFEAESDRLAVLEPDLVGPAGLAPYGVESPVVEDVAVLVDLDEGRALVGRRL